MPCPFSQSATSLQVQSQTQTEPHQQTKATTAAAPQHLSQRRCCCMRRKSALTALKGLAVFGCLPPLSVPPSPSKWGTACSSRCVCERVVCVCVCVCVCLLCVRVCV